MSDTRVSYVGGALPPHDDQLKVVSFGPGLIGGFANDIATAREAVPAIRESFRNQRNLDPDEVGTAVQSILITAVRDLDGRGVRRSDNFYALLGCQGPTENQFQLIYLSSNNGFEPEVKRGLYAVGDGWKDFVSIYDATLDNARGAPRDPWKGPDMPVVGLANWLAEMMELKIEDSLEIATDQKRDSYIGGFPRVLALTKEGQFDFYGRQLSEDEGNSFQLTLYPIDDLRL